MPTLVVVRHAKADRPAGMADIDRPLLPRGRSDARAAGDWLAGSVGRVDLVVSSPARRAVETVEELLSAYDAAPPVVYEESVYEATLGDLLHVVRDLDTDDDTVLLVGHDPAMSALVTDLTGTPTELRTCGVTVIHVPGPWADAPPGGCELVESGTPRG